MNGQLVPRTRSRTAVAVLCFAILLVGCEDEEIFVTVDPDNLPPTIVEQGPELSAGSLDVIGCCGPELWVLVGDINGLDDISVVFLDVQSIRINDLILRAETPDGGCANFSYVPDDTVDTSSFVAFPAQLPGVERRTLNQDQGGVYRFSPFVVPRIEPIAIEIGPPTGCATMHSLARVTLEPPAVPATANAFLTFIDVDYIGITVTVFDAAGESATTTFPDLRVIHSTIEETTVAP